MNLFREWRKFLSAIRFLTIWPGGKKREAPLAAWGAYFPLVGTLVGVAAVITASIFRAIFSPAIFPVVAVLSLLIFTRALQTESLANILEGFAVGQTPEERLRVMGESYFGTIGSLSLLGLLLIKVTALANTPPEAWTETLLGAATLSRWTMTYLFLKGPYLAPGKGLGFVGHVKRGDMVFASATAVLVGGLALGVRGLILLLILWAGSTAARAYFRRSLGGITKAVYGAVGEAGETLVLLTSMG